MVDQDFLSIYDTCRHRLEMTPMDYLRPLHDIINWSDRLIYVNGARGCGKTTLFQQHIKKAFPDSSKVLYASLDNLWFTVHALRDLADYHVSHGGTHLFLDEVHYLPNWQLQIKNLYDDFPELNIAYTGSSMLKLDNGKGDLSRRQMVYELPGLSFREYLAFEGVMTVPAVTLEELLLNHRDIAADICSKVKILSWFDEYLDHGYYPFYKEVKSGYHYRLEQIINTVLEIDYPANDDVSANTIHKTRRMLMLLASQTLQTPNMSALYAQLETERNQGLKMLTALERAGLLTLLPPQKQTLKSLERPEKIYLDNANQMMALVPSPDLGTLRETAFASMLKHHCKLSYPSAGDFRVNDRYLFEVGGKGKTFKQIKDIPDSFLAIDNLEVGMHNRLPLWVFGLL